MPKKRLPLSKDAWPPKKYQLKALRFMLSRGAAGLFLDPGLGKTSISLAAISFLLSEKVVEAAIVVAPVRVCYSVWRQEGERWADFRHLSFSLLHGPKKAQALREKADVYLITPDGLDLLLANKRWLAGKKLALFVDESTKFKSPKSERFRKLKRLLRYFFRRYILTGTPAPNGLLNLFGQIYILDQGIALGRYISHYQETHFDEVGFGWEVKDGSEKKIHRLLKPLTLSMSAEDYGELPELIINDIGVDLPESARKVYKEMERELITILNGGESITASSAAAASMKCRQIANGSLYRQKSSEDLRRSDSWVDLHDAKLEATEDLVEELSGQPALILYEFEHDLARLRRAFGKDLPAIGGGMSAKKSDDLARLWNAGKLPLMAGQPAAMGHGLNLQQGGHHVIWHSLIWDLELYDQAIRRVYRQGVSKSVTVHRIFARKTIDLAILSALEGKARTQQALLFALRATLRAR